MYTVFLQAQGVDIDCPVGLQIPKVTRWLLDEHMRLVPDRETGALYSGGPCLAHVGNARKLGLLQSTVCPSTMPVTTAPAMER